MVKFILLCFYEHFSSFIFYKRKNFKINGFENQFDNNEIPLYIYVVGIY